MKERDLDIYDVWESPNGNRFIKMCDDYSLAIGTKGQHTPNESWGELNHSQYVKSNEVIPVKKVGRIIFEE